MNRLMGVLDKLLLSLSQWFTKSGLSPRSHSVFVAVFHWHCLVQLVLPLHYWGANYYLIRVFVLLTNALVNVYASTATHSSKGEHAQQHVAWLASLPLLSQSRPCTTGRVPSGHTVQTHKDHLSPSASHPLHSPSFSWHPYYHTVL